MGFGTERATCLRVGLLVRAEFDRGHYPAGVSVTDAQMARVRLERHRFHGDWNYTIRLSVSNSLSGRHGELDQVPAMGNPPRMVQISMGHRASSTGEGHRRVAF